MEQPYAIEMLNITKRFPGIVANDNITLQLKRGEIHALLGENGAGKSTLMSVLFGLYQPEEGVIKKDGQVVQIKDPNDANALGIGMVHQHFKLVECFSILDNIILGALFSDNQYVTIAIPLTVIVAVGIWVLLEKTKLGYELRATGCNKFAAKYCGMKEKRNIILTMAIAGGLAGMGAATLFLTGFEQWQVTQSAVPAMGFNGIAAAFLGGLNPIGAIFSSYFIQHITNGGAYVDKTMYSAQISDLISALIIYLCGFVLFFKVFMNSRLDRRDEKRRAKEDRPGSEEGGKA